MNEATCGHPIGNDADCLNRSSALAKPAQSIAGLATDGRRRSSETFRRSAPTCPRVRGRQSLVLDGSSQAPILCGMANEVLQWTLKEFERGLDAAPTADDVSITVEGRRLDSKTAVLDWWADVAAAVEAEEAARQALPGA